VFRQILFTQWKWSRLVVLLGVLAGFALPVLSVQHTAYTNPDRWEARAILSQLQSWGVLYPVLATALAVIIAMAAWAADHRGRHVYALSLPLPRWHYALLRFGAGAVLLVAPILALWVGAVLASSTLTVPPGLHAYPTELAVRFGLALFAAYATFFAISAGTARTAGYILGVLGVLIAVQFIAQAGDVDLPVLNWIWDRLSIWPGPLDVFTGRWMLIDV
jgi:hypothetical protein